MDTAVKLQQDEPHDTPEVNSGRPTGTPARNRARARWTEFRRGLSVSLLALAVVTLLRSSLDDGFANLPFVLYVPAVIAASLAGGLRIGALTTVLSLITGWVLFVQPPNTLAKGTASDFARAAVFTAAGLVISYVIDSMLKSRNEAKKNARRFTGTFENAAVGMALVDLDGRWLEVNQRLCHILGEHRDDLLSKPCMKHAHPEDAPAAQDMFARLATGEVERASMDQRCIRADGQAVWVTWTASLQRHDNGSPERLIVVLEDTSSRKAAEQQARQLADIIEATPDVVAMGGLQDGRILYLNGAGRRMLGVQPDADLAKLRYAEFCPEWVFERTRNEWLPAALRDGSAAGEGALVDADGREIPVSFALVVHRDGKGVPHAVSTIARDMSARKQAESTLRESEARLRLALEAGRLGTWDWDIRSDRVVWSQGLEQINGIVEGSRPTTFNEFLAMIHPEDRSRVRAAVDHTLATDAYYDVEFRISTPQGTRWASRRGRVFRDAGGQAVRMLGVGADVTDRKRIDEALRSNTERLAMALEAAAMVAWEWDPATGRVTRTGDVHHVFGFDASSISEQEFMELIHPEDVPRVKQMAERSMDGTGEYAVEYRLLHRDGSIRWCSDRGHWQRATDASGGRMFGILVDVTARKIAEHELHSAKRQLENILESIQESFIAVDREWRYTYVNDRVLKIVGMTREQMVGQNLWDLTPEAKETAFWTYYQRVMEDRIPQEFEMHYPSTDQWFEVHAYPTDEGLSAFVLDITDRHRAEVALRETEQQRRLITDSLPVLISYVDSDRRYQFNNRTYERWFGLDPNQLRGRRVEEVLGDQAYSEIEPHVQAALRGEVQTFQSVLGYNSGGPRHVSATFVPDVADAGEVRGYFGLIEDVTDRKRLEESLRDSEERYRSIVEAAAEGIWILDEAGVTSFVNPRMGQLLGYAPEQMIGRSCFEFLHPDDVARAREGFILRKQDGKPTAREYRYIRSDERVVWLSFTGSRICDATGRLTSVLAMCTDTTERRLNEERIRQLNTELSAKVAEFEALMRVLPVGIMFTHDPECRIAELNPAAEQMLGVEPGANASKSGSDAMKLPFKILQDGVEVAAEQLPLQVTARSGKPVRDVEYEILRADGIVRQVIGWANPLLDDRNDPAGAVVAFLDITERKATENALRRANEALEQFAYAAAHDLQEPIRNVALYTQLLARKYQGRFDSEGEDFLHTTVEGARRMQNLIQDLLSYTRATDAEEADMVSADGNAVMAEVLQNLRTMIQTAGADVHHGTLPTVGVSHTQLVQLLQNLVSNAIKYRRAERPRVDITAQAQGRHWMITVSDNGQGIPAEHHQRVFRVFKRLHGREIPGTGIGLAICERIVAHHGGRIWVDSAVGQGASFHFTVPACGAPQS